VQIQPIWQHLILVTVLGFLETYRKKLFLLLIEEETGKIMWSGFCLNEKKKWNFEVGGITPGRNFFTI